MGEQKKTSTIAEIWAQTLQDTQSVLHRYVLKNPYQPSSLPHYSHPDFTNPDPRLRPQWPLKSVNSFSKGYIVSPEAFPELFKAVTTLIKNAGLKPSEYHLVITNDIAPYAGRFYPERKVFAVSLNSWNALPFEQLLQQPIGHEIGHAWRNNNPSAKSFPKPIKFSPEKFAEYEADLLAVCLRARTDGLNGWMNNHSHGIPETYPTNAELSAALTQLKWKDCPVAAPDLPPLRHWPKSKIALGIPSEFLSHQ